CDLVVRGRSIPTHLERCLTMTEAAFNNDTMSSSEEVGTVENSAETSVGASDLELFEQYLDADTDFDIPERGDLREGVIVEIRPHELLVNVGSKRDGVVPQSDLSKLDPEFVASLVEGQTIDVVVSRQSEDDGAFQLSIADALQQRDWSVAQDLLDNGEIVTQEVIGFNKGGLTVAFNHLKGFVPASHLIDLPRNLSEEQRRTALENYIGSELRLKVIEVDRRRRRLVMSQMLAEREFRANRREELFETLKVGDVIQGEVRNLRPFGAFVDIGGADGLLHVSEIGWSPVNHPRDVLSVGDKIEVQVIRLDPNEQRIGLSRKRVLPNPWTQVEDHYKVGDIVTAKITRVVDFGAFAQLEPGIEGLIHISELADIAVAEPLKTVSSGDEVAVKILRIEPKRQRIGLSRRQADGEVVPEANDEETNESNDEEAAS
ncbi:MAG: S1 RNA-binding domain-containing protein, partial [Caldilineaceae bacterium]|nr:S1 RNA-binding domain-containing protein [Caldilineaceae bacterium]MCB0186578.1 S1 RNA-binding domain-containing protein [Caldilineaceae bacterium]